MMKIDFKDFTENNIQFRVISSKLLERYKGAQSFVLSEMIHGKFKFSKTSRELAILIMDTTFAWLIQIENYIIRDNEKTFNIDAVNFSIKSFEEMDMYILSLVDKHHDIFSENVSIPWRMIHKTQTELAKTVIKSAEGLSDLEAFSTIANVIIEMIDTMKFQLYEIDSMNNQTKKPPLCLTDLCILSVSEFDLFPMLERARVYNDVFKVDSGFYFKNYSQESNPFTYIKKLEDAGIKIVNKNSAMVP